MVAGGMMLQMMRGCSDTWLKERAEIEAHDEEMRWNYMVAKERRSELLEERRRWAREWSA